jgi:transcriptional regulator with XRE-family HTH domain
VPVPSPAQLGVTIRRLRTMRRLSIEALAGAAGIHTTYLSGIERGRRNPTWRVIGCLAHALGMDISELARHAQDLADCEGERPDSNPRPPA